MGLLAALTFGALGGCSEHAPSQTDASELVESFFAEYDEFAKAGYPGDLPKDLDVLIDGSAEEVVIDDASWWRSREYRQHGSTEVTSTRFLSESSTTAIIEVDVDTSGVEVLSKDGETVSEGGEAVQTMLITLAFGEHWTIVSIDAA